MPRQSCGVPVSGPARSVALLAIIVGLGCGGGGGEMPGITVTSPGGGESWRIGSTQVISWICEGVPNVKIEISRDGTWNTPETVIATASGMAGSYSWTVTGPGSADCLVRISDATDGSPADVSRAAFVITPVAIWHVDDSAAPGGDGTSWTLAFQKLQEGLAAASPGDEIWVAAGTYKPAELRFESFRLAEGVAVYGGFAGTPGTEGDFAVRDWIVHETILSGDIGIVGDPSDNCYVIVDATSISGSRLDGLTITDGYNDSRSAYGAGLGNWSASLTVANCVFADNTGTWLGGGIYNRGASSMVVINCVFTGNSSEYGGGIWNGSSLVLTNCTFTGNSATQYGGAVLNASHPTEYDGRLAVTNCLLWGNTAVVEGSEIQNDGTSSCTVTYSCVGQAGYAGANGNINSDPLFVNAASGDLHLQPSSPCIDAGDPATALATDLDGNPRPAGSGYDMGAYEYQP